MARPDHSSQQQKKAIWNTLGVLQSPYLQLPSSKQPPSNNLLQPDDKRKNAKAYPKRLPASSAWQWCNIKSWLRRGLTDIQGYTFSPCLKRWFECSRPDFSIAFPLEEYRCRTETKIVKPTEKSTIFTARPQPQAQQQSLYMMAAIGLKWNENPLDAIARTWGWSYVMKGRILLKQGWWYTEFVCKEKEARHGKAWGALFMRRGEDNDRVRSVRRHSQTSISFQKKMWWRWWDGAVVTLASNPG